jgi:hypothetical protein
VLRVASVLVNFGIVISRGVKYVAENWMCGLSEGRIEMSRLVGCGGQKQKRQTGASPPHPLLLAQDNALTHKLCQSPKYTHVMG